jgi:ABC-type Mn2+/Zn2+ transport system ATPase subunit
MALAVLRGVAAGYGGPPALDGVGFEVPAGRRIGVLGPNAGGKTTLFRVLSGELVPVAGEVHVAGRCGIVPQTDRSRLDFPVSALDVALMGTIAGRPWWRPPSRSDRARALDALARVDLGEQAGAAFGSLSGGQRQRVLIARALAQDAQLLLLDEPFTGLDAPGAARLEALLSELAAHGRSVLIATHDLAQARAWDLVLCLNRRQIAFGPPAEVLTREVLEATYGAALVELPGPDGPRLAVLPPHHHDHDHP